MTPDTTQEAITDGLTTKAIQRLSALDNLFEAEGIAQVKVTRGKREVTLELPIQSIDNEVIETAAKPFRPKTPVRREMVQGKWVSVIDEQNQEYQDKMSEYNRVLSYLMIFHGLAIDILDEQGSVVWSADNTIQNFSEARRIARKMGLVDNHMVSIMRSIRQLTADVEEEQSRD